MNLSRRVTAGLIAITAGVANWAAAGVAAADTLVAPIAAPSGYGAARPLTTPSDSADGGRAQVVTDATGTTTAVWTDRAGPQARLRTATQPVGGTWSAPTTLAFRTVSARGLEPVPVRLVASPTGAPNLLWGWFVRATGVPRVLNVSTRAADGSWSTHTVAAVHPHLRLGPTADLAVTSDGTLLVAWSRATRVATTYVRDEVPTGRLELSERRPDGTWQSRLDLARANGVSAAPILTTNHAGGAAVAWLRSGGDDPESGPTAWAVRGANGRWSIGAPLKRDVSRARLDEAGRLHLLTDGFGPWGLDGFVDSVAAAGKLAASSAMPSPSDAQTLDGWLGAGYMHSAGVELTPAGELVVVWAGEPLDVERGGYGTGALWAATRSTDGRWSVGQVDPLTQTSGTLDVDLSTDASGQMAATWSAAESSGTCGSVIYRSVRSSAGIWSPRAVVATGGNAPRYEDRDLRTGSCTAVAPHLTEGARPAVWWIEQGPRRLVVAPLGDTEASPAPSVAAESLATSWADVRRSGGLPIRCAVSAPAHCSVSIVDALAGLPDATSEQDPVRFTSRALRCLRLRATAPVGNGADQSTVLLPAVPGCMQGWSPPTMTFDALVVVDAPGATPATAHVAVTLHR